MSLRLWSECVLGEWFIWWLEPTSWMMVGLYMVVWSIMALSGLISLSVSLVRNVQPVGCFAQSALGRCFIFFCLAFFGMSLGHNGCWIDQCGQGLVRSRELVARVYVKRWGWELWDVWLGLLGLDAWLIRVGLLHVWRGQSGVMLIYQERDEYPISSLLGPRPLNAFHVKYLLR